MFWRSKADSALRAQSSLCVRGYATSWPQQVSQSHQVGIKALTYEVCLRGGRCHDHSTVIWGGMIGPPAKGGGAWPGSHLTGLSREGGDAQARAVPLPLRLRL